MTEFASGITQVFHQTSAPVGWTKVTTFNQAMMRVTTSSVSSGGSSNFNTILTNRSTNSVSLGTSQIGSHSHNYPAKEARNGNTDRNFTCAGSFSIVWANTSNNLNNPPLGGSHNHSIDLSCRYTDVILATVD